MALITKLRQRLSDPTFYRKRWSQMTKSTPYREPRPISLDELPTGRLLVAIAHPDDESFCSGLLCELSSVREITVFCSTRGEGGGTGGFASREELGAIREAELRTSCSCLGIDDLHFGDYRDPIAEDYRIFAPSIPSGELQHRIAGFAPDLIITHGSGGEYWHPAHLQLHDAVMGLGLPMLTFNAWNPDHSLPRLLNRHDPADLVFDSSAHREKRLAALCSHRTQAHYFEEVAGGLEKFIDATAVECFCRG